MKMQNIKCRPHRYIYPNHKRLYTRRGQGGFSIFEALFGLILTMIGFTAVFRLQGAQMTASLTTRDMSAASNIAEVAVSMLIRESYEWNTPLRTGERLGKTPIIWHSLTKFPVDHNMQVHRDNDQAQGTLLNRQRFCVHYWFNDLDGLYDGLLNARVRVVWPRDPKDQNSISTICGDENVANFVPDPSRWLSLTVPFILRRHP